MGTRKRINLINAKIRKAAKITRDKNRVKRIAKGKTAGQLLAEKLVA